MAKTIILLFVLVAEVQSKTLPYVSFNGQTLVNHSFVDLNLVGSDSSGSDSVQCHTDLSTCCTEAQGIHRGDWYYPSSQKLYSIDFHDVYEVRGVQRVDLRQYYSVLYPRGIYRCDIPTVAVHHPTDNSVRDTVYVGLYTSGGEYILWEQLYNIDLGPQWSKIVYHIIQGRSKRNG